MQRSDIGDHYLSAITPHLSVSRPSGMIEGFVGQLAGRTPKVASLEEMNEAAADGWAGLHQDVD